MRVQKASVVTAAVLIGVAVGVFITWTVGLSDGRHIQVLEGRAWVNQEGIAIGLSPDGETPGIGYVVAGATWRQEAGPWHDAFATCLEPLAIGQQVRLGVLHTRPQGEAPARPIVVWLECLE